ncbi:type I-G CRISPR-associated protein Cas8g2 [Nitrospira sp. Kam-Ns4a]
MAKASIPVDLFNPGQVFACLGFLEAAGVLLGHAEGGFDWTHETEPRFDLCADGEENPLRFTLGFLAEAQLQRLVPAGYTDPPPKRRAKGKKTNEANAYADEEANDTRTADGPLCPLDTFPARDADRLTLPVRLLRNDRQLDLTHWCDGSSRNSFKLFAGQQRSSAIVRQMLAALRELWNGRRDDLVRDPFGVTVPLGGSSFKFDARKAWTAIDAGYSPDEQENAVEASPVVELLAAGGLEHARPDEFETREVRYGVWKGLLPLALARPALGGVRIGVPMRTFRFTLDLAGKNKIVTFAREET